MILLQTDSQAIKLQNLQQLRLNNACLLAYQPVRLNPSVPRKVKSLVFSGPAVAEVNFCYDQLICRSVRLGYNMSLRINNATAANEVELPIIQTAACRGNGEAGVHVAVRLLDES